MGELGDYIELSDERNHRGNYTAADVRGISADKRLIDTKANMDGVSVSSYKVVRPAEFVYVPDTSRRGDRIALAHNGGANALLVSSIYTVFRLRNGLLPEYLYMLCYREEFDRYARFNSWGSARETFSWQELCRVCIPPTSIWSAASHCQPLPLHGGGQSHCPGGERAAQGAVPRAHTAGRKKLEHGKTGIGINKRSIRFV